MVDQGRNEEELVSEIVDLCGQISELGVTLLVKRGFREAPSEEEPSGQGVKVYDLPWWAERAKRLKSLDVGDIASLSANDVARLIREFQAHQVEAKMQNEELKRIHKELKEARDKYTDLYDFAPVGYFTLSKAGLILEVNQTGAALLGRARDWLIGKPFSSCVCHDDYPPYYAHLKEVFGTKIRRTCEIQLERHNRPTFPARLESVAVRDSKREFSQCRTMVSDIKDLKLAQKALKESEELHRIILSSISDTVLITDDDGFFTYVCPNIHVIFGHSKEDVEALQRIERLLGPDIFDPSMLEHVEEIQNVERRISDRSGGEHVLLVNIKRVSIKGGTVLFSCRDVTALKKAQEELEISRRTIV